MGTFQLSRMAFDLILKLRIHCLPFYVADHNQHFHRTSNEGHSKQHQLDKVCLEGLVRKFNEGRV